jgi:hypothetical protein
MYDGFPVSEEYRRLYGQNIVLQVLYFHRSNNAFGICLGIIPFPKFLM